MLHSHQHSFRARCLGHADKGIIGESAHAVRAVYHAVSINLHDNVRTGHSRQVCALTFSWEGLLEERCVSVLFPANLLLITSMAHVD